MTALTDAAIPLADQIAHIEFCMEQCEQARDWPQFEMEKAVLATLRAYDHLAREKGELLAALDKYGWHNHKCAALSDHSADARIPELACSCGYDTALSASPTAEPGPEPKAEESGRG